MSSRAGLVRVVPAGDGALLAEFPLRIDPGINDAASALAATLSRRWASVLRDVVVSYATVTVYFDPMSVDGRWLEAEVRTAASLGEDTAGGSARVIDVPVCYGEECGPDLPAVAEFGGCSIEEVIERHERGIYRVYAIGFVPGFPYLAEVDARIAAPRRAVPRTAVPAGSVGIAGPQTGIYPSQTPGGWNLIGRTAVRPFDPGDPATHVFRVGDEVRFRRVAHDLLPSFS